MALTVRDIGARIFHKQMSITDIDVHVIERRPAQTSR